MSGNDEKSLKNSLLRKLDDRTIVIWGARMTGLGLARFLTANQLQKARAFVDSDIALHGKTINMVQVISPAQLQELKKEDSSILVVVAVSLKEDEIISMLKEIGFGDNDFIVYSDFSTDFYTIDVVGACNLKCASCAHGSSGMDSPVGYMSFSNFELVVEKMLSETEVVSHVSLYNWGESLLHPELDKIIELLHKKGIAVAMSSNLSIKDENKIDSMIKSAPDYLKISLSGYYPEAYEDTHAGGDINLVKSNLYRLRYLIDKYGVSTLVDVNYHLYNNNCGKNLEKMKELCIELDFSISTTYSLVMPLERVIDHCDGKTSDEVMLLNQKLLVSVDEGIEASSGLQMNGCPFRDNQVNINWDLSVPVCCTVYNRNEGTIVSKNYLQTSLLEINSMKMKVELCSKCIRYGLPAYNMGFNRAKWEIIAKTKSCMEQA